MKEYYIVVGNWTTTCQEVSNLLNNGYQLAGNLVVVAHVDNDDDSHYVLYYQPMVGEKSE